jgi:CHAT domain-containing protein
VHFATHGLVASDVVGLGLDRAEPALVLTPPLGTPENVNDDGLLTASEVTELKLNAEWVVMSACNTAAGNKLGAEALSGLARAFFYAGARALLASHWPVYSDAAVRLTTSAFGYLDRHPHAGRADALQRAMIELMDDRSQADNAHPAVWAPFVVVGEGAR